MGARGSVGVSYTGWRATWMCLTGMQRLCTVRVTERASHQRCGWLRCLGHKTQPKYRLSRQVQCNTRPDHRDDDEDYSVFQPIGPFKLEPRQDYPGRSDVGQRDTNINDQPNKRKQSPSPLCRSPPYSKNGDWPDAGGSGAISVSRSQRVRDDMH